MNSHSDIAGTSNQNHEQHSDSESGSDVYDHNDGEHNHQDFFSGNDGHRYHTTLNDHYNEKGMYFLGYSWWMWIFFPWIVFPILILDLLFEKIVNECYPEMKKNKDLSTNHHTHSTHNNRRHNQYNDSSYHRRHNYYYDESNL